MSLVEREQGTWYFDLLVLIIFMIMLFGILLGARPLSTPDEARYAEIPREMLALHDAVTPHLNGVKYFEKPPLFYWIQAAFIRLFSSAVGKSNPAAEAKRNNFVPVKSISEWVVRLPNACLALLGCLFLYSAGRLLFNRQTGFLSSVILATSLLYFTLARLVTLDMCLSVCLSGSLLAFLVATRFPLGLQRRALCYVAYILSALAVLTKGLVGIVFPVMIVGLWVLLTQQWALVRQSYLSSGILLFLLIVLPWHILVQERNPEFFRFYFVDQQFLRYSTLIAQRYQPSWFFIPILIGGFLPWTVFLPQAIAEHFPKTRQQLKEKSTSVFLLLWIAIIFVFFSLSHSKLIPYILPAFPAMALLTGHYLSIYLARRSVGIKRGAIALPCIWLVLSIPAILWYLLEPAIGLQKPGLLLTIVGYFIFLVASVLAVFFYARRGVQTAFTLLAVGSAISFIILFTGAVQTDTRSIKPLVHVLRPLLRPKDAIAAYNNYYQDLPFYLNHRVLTVNVAGELSFGMQHQDTTSWMLNPDRFWLLWHGHQRVFMIASQTSYHQVLQDKEKPMYWVAATPHDVLLSNQPVKKRIEEKLPERTSP